jgi:acyl carrier protein
MELVQENSILEDVKSLIISSVNLMHVDASQITAVTSLGPGGLNLDSIDALEVIIVLEKRFGFKIENSDEWRKHFTTLGSVVDFVQTHRKV